MSHEIRFQKAGLGLLPLLERANRDLLLQQRSRSRGGESIDWLTRPLTRAFDQGLNFFEGQSQGTQVLDDLHTPECFFPKQTIVALAPAQGGEEPEALILAQDFDWHSGA
jgi:hypothetical protein